MNQWVIDQLVTLSQQQKIRWETKSLMYEYHCQVTPTLLVTITLKTDNNGPPRVTLHLGDFALSIYDAVVDLSLLLAYAQRDVDGHNSMTDIHSILGNAVTGSSIPQTNYVGSIRGPDNWIHNVSYHSNRFTCLYKGLPYEAGSMHSLVGIINAAEKKGLSRE